MEEKAVGKSGAKEKTKKVKESITSQMNGHVLDLPEQVNGDRFEYEDGLETVLESFVNGADPNFDDFNDTGFCLNEDERTNGNSYDNCNQSWCRLRSERNPNARIATENHQSNGVVNGRKYDGQDEQDPTSMHQHGYSRNVCDLYRHENDLIFGRTRGGILRNNNQILVVADGTQSKINRNPRTEVNPVDDNRSDIGNVCTDVEKQSAVSSLDNNLTHVGKNLSNSALAPLATPESFSDDEGSLQMAEQSGITNGIASGHNNETENLKGDDETRCCQTDEEKDKAESGVSSGQTFCSFDDDASNYLESASLDDHICALENKSIADTKSEVPQSNEHVDTVSSDQIGSEEVNGSTEDSNQPVEDKTSNEESVETDKEIPQQEDLEYTSDISNDMDEGNCYDEIEEGPDGSCNQEVNENSDENLLEVNDGHVELENVGVLNEQQTEDDSGNNEDIGDFIEADLPPNVERLVFFSRDSSSDEDEGCGDEVLPNNDEDVVSDNETVDPTGREYAPPVTIKEQKVRNDCYEHSYGASNILSDVDVKVRGEMSYLYPCNISCDKSTEENDSDSKEESEEFVSSLNSQAVECAACNSQNNGYSSIEDRNSVSSKGDNLCACCDRPMEIDCQRQKEMGINVCDLCFREHNSEQSRWSENLFGARRKSRPSSGSSANFLLRNTANSLNPLTNNYDKVSNNSPLYGRFSSSDSDPFDRIYVSDSSDMVSPEMEAAMESVFQSTSRRSPDVTMAPVKQVRCLVRAEEPWIIKLFHLLCTLLMGLLKACRKVINWLKKKSTQAVSPCCLFINNLQHIFSNLQYVTCISVLH